MSISPQGLNFESYVWNIHENITIKHGYINNDVGDQL
jgi:hypothetical protein